METLNKDSVTQLFLQDFQIQHGCDVQEKDYKIRSNTQSMKLFLLFALDFWLCHLIIGPSVVAFWRGVWESSHSWLEVGLCHGDINLANILALLTGLFVTCLIDTGHHQVARNAGKIGSLRHSIIKNVFSIVWGWGDITMWKGLWDGYDHWAGWGIHQAMLTMFIGFIILTLSRTLRSAQSMPIGINVDSASSHINCETYLSSSSSSSITRRMQDMILSRMLEFAVILHWHGVWSTMDIVMEDMMEMTRVQSSWLSLVMGWSVAILLFIFQFPLLIIYRRCRSQMSKNGYYIIFQVYIILGVVSTIASFRGAWYLLDEYLITCDPFSSQVIGMFLGLAVLCSLRTVSCLHAGVFSDNPSDGIMIGFHLTSFWYIESNAKNSELQDRKINTKMPDT